MCEMKQEGQFSKNNNLLLYAIQLVCVLKWNKRDSFQKKNTNLLYAIQLVCVLKWNKRDSFQKKTHQFITVCYSTCVHIEMKQDGQFSKKSNLWQYAIQLVCEMKQEGQFSKTTIYYIMRIEMKQEGQYSKKSNNCMCAYWNETRGTVFKKKTIYYSMLFNLCAYWNETRGAVFKKIQLMTICYWTCVRNETRGAVFKKTTIYYSMLFNLCAYWNETRGTVFKKQQFITVCYSTCVRIEMKQEGQFSKKKKNTNLLQYAIQLVCILKWNKRDSFQKNPIYDNMLLNLCAKWNKRGSFQKTTIYYSMLFNLCAYWNETRGAVFKKIQLMTICYSTCVCIEMKQEGQFSKKKQQIYYSMLFNLCAYWNETRGTVFKKIQLMTICYWTHVRNETRGLFNFIKKQQFITVCYSTCVRIEMKQEGQFSKNNNLLLYAIQLVCVLKWNKRDSFQEKKNKKNTNLLQYAIQLVCILKWNKRGSFQKNPIDDNMLLNSCAKWNKRGSFQKTTIYYCMLFNLCAYWNETRGTVFKKHQFITVCYSTCMQYQKQSNLLLNLCAKWNKRGSFQKTTIYYSMLNLCPYWNETRGAVFKKNLTICIFTDFKKIQFITVCYSTITTCVRIEMKQEGQFSKKNNLLQYAIQLVCVLKWNKRDSFQKQKKNTNLLQYAIQMHIEMKQVDSFQKNPINEMKQEGQFSKNNNLLQYAIQLVCVLKWNKRDSFQKNPKQYATELMCEKNKRGKKNTNLLLFITVWNKMDSFSKKSN